MLAYVFVNAIILFGLESKRVSTLPHIVHVLFVPMYFCMFLLVL